VIASLKGPFEGLQQDETLAATCLLGQCKYLHNVVERDYRFVTRRITPG
jgi:hypothetical protein